MKDFSILRHEENGVEYFTVIATGESALSVRGLAKVSGIPYSTLQRWLEDLTHKGVPDWLKPLAAMDLYLTHEITKRGKQIKAVLAKWASKFIGLVAINLKTEQAIQTLADTSEIGFTSVIQAKTGWLPEEYQSSKDARDRISQIIQELPRSWQLHFNAKWQKEAMRLTGYRWRADIRMASFISRSIYKIMPKDVYDRLMKVNSDRKKCHHQFFTEAADELVLKQHIQQVHALMLASDSMTQFWRLMRNAFGEGIQIELDLDI